MINKLIGGKITNVSRICNLVSIEVDINGKKKFLHIQSFFRILNAEKVIISSEDMYKKGEMCNEDSFEWDVVGQSLFDDTLNKNRGMLFAASIRQAKIDANGDISILLDNNIVLQIFIDTTISEEKYRIFDEDNVFIVNS